MIPIDFEVRANAYAMRNTWLHQISQVEENRLLAPGWETEILLRDFPATVAVGHFDAHALRAPTTPLRDRDVHGRFRVVNRAVCDQVKRATGWRIVAEI